MQILRNSIIYIALNAVGSIIPFLLIPYYTRVLTASDFGIFSSFQIVAGVISPFLSWGFLALIEQSQIRDDETKRHETIRVALLFLAVTSLVSLVLLLTARNALSKFIPMSLTVAVALVLVPLSQTINQMLLTIYQMAGEAYSYARLNLLNVTANTSLSIFFVYKVNPSWIGRVDAAAFSSALLTVYALRKIYKRLPGNSEVDYKSTLSRMISFGTPLVAYSIVGFFTQSIDKAIVISKLGAAEGGLYSLGYQFSQVVQLTLLAVNTACVPMLYRALKENCRETDAKIVKWSYRAVALSIALSAAFGLIAPALLRPIIGERFSGALGFLLVLSLAQGVRAIYFTTCNYITYSGKTHYILAAMVISLAVQVPVTTLLVTRWGATGAAYSALICNTLSSLITFSFAAKAHPMPWTTRK